MTVEASPPRALASSGWLRAALLIAYLALIVPVLIVDVPPLVDYTNHNARLWLIAGGIDLAPMRDFYAVDWSRASTNIGIDLIAATLGPLIGKDHVGPFCLILTIVLPALGALALHRRIFGGAHWWQLTFVLPAFGKTVLAGYLNFHIGVGLALLAAALDDRIGRLGTIPAFIVRALLTALILLFHPFAALGYGGLLLALAIGREVTPLTSLQGIRSKLWPCVLAVAATVIPVVLLMVFSPHPPVARDGHTIIQWEHFSIVSAVGDLLVAFHTFSDTFDIFIVAMLAIPVVIALVTRKISIHTGLFLAGVAFVVLTLVMPTRIGDGYDLEFRPPVLAVYLLLVSIRPNFATSRRAAGVMAGLFFALAIVRTSFITAAWVRDQDDAHAVLAALAKAPEGSPILSMTLAITPAQRAEAPFGRYIGDIPTFYAYPPLVVTERHGFAPNIWALPGQQPLRATDAWLPMFAPQGDRPPHIPDLYAKTQPEGREYLVDWRRFDYILMLNADAPSTPEEQFAPGDVDLVSDNGFARLYRIRKIPAPAPAQRPAGDHL
jgi:hypothetical protein